LEERTALVKNPDCIAVRMSRLNTLSVRAKSVFDLVNITVRLTSNPEHSELCIYDGETLGREAHLR
jgi:hypothetical protein